MLVIMMVRMKMMIINDGDDGDNNDENVDGNGIKWNGRKGKNNNNKREVGG